MTKQQLNIPKEKRDDPEFKGLLQQADKLHDLSALASTEGGKALIGLLIKEAVYCVHRLRSSYRTATHPELLATIAELGAKIDTATLLLSAKESEDVINERLEEALRE